MWLCDALRATRREAQLCAEISATPQVAASTGTSRGRLDFRVLDFSLKEWDRGELPREVLRSPRKCLGHWMWLYWMVLDPVWIVL